jgi:stage III sporulation protein SpoIIIAA
MSQVFDKIGGGLLILGAPGSGKTSMLLELARDLLNAVKADDRQPMPWCSLSRRGQPIARRLASG